MGSASGCSEFRSCLSFSPLSLPYYDSPFASSIPFLLECVPYPSMPRPVLEFDASPLLRLGGYQLSLVSRPLCAARTVTLLLPSLARSSLLPFLLWCPVPLCYPAMRPSSVPPLWLVAFYTFRHPSELSSTLLRSWYPSRHLQPFRWLVQVCFLHSSLPFFFRVPTVRCSLSLPFFTFLLSPSSSRPTT